MTYSVSFKRHDSEIKAHNLNEIKRINPIRMLAMLISLVLYLCALSANRDSFFLFKPQYVMPT